MTGPGTGSPEEISLIVDGHQIKTKKGKMVLEASLEAGLYIPYLCFYPGMKPWGACRMCVVEIQGVRGTPASCTVPVAEGMVVKSNTPLLQELRRGIMELLLSEHPHGCLTCHRIELCGPQDVCLRHVTVTDRCVICPKNERCELKDTVRYLQMDLETPLTYNYRNLPLEVRDPFYDRDYNLCIVCNRCVRVCEEVRADNAICMVERSGTVLVGTSQGKSLLESGCEFCGACIDVCPTGALVERNYKWEKAVRTVTTICPHCPVGCQMKLEVDHRERVIRAIPQREAAANRGQACFKGKFGMDFVNHKARLKAPLVRRNGTLVEASWDEALDLAAAGLREYSGEAFALIASARGSNEENYLAQKFARLVMQSNNVDHSSNVRPELVMGLQGMLQFPAATNSIWELKDSRCILVVDSNTTEAHNVAAVPIKQAARNGARLLVVDPREVELTRYAHLWLRPRPGTEVALVAGILQVVEGEGWGDQDFLSSRCQNVTHFRESLNKVDLHEVAELSGVPEEKIREAARTFAQNRPAAILYALDNTPEGHRLPLVQALANLALLTGNVGQPSSGLFPLRVGTNEQGSWDVGCVPHFLPGYRSLEGEEAKAVEAVWGNSIPRHKGRGLKEVFRAVREGRVKGMVLLGDSPYFTNGELGDVLEVLKGLEFLVVCDSFLGPWEGLAHVVLPSATFVEQEGTFTSMERRIQLLRKGLEPRGNSRPNWWILCQIARRLGASGFEYSSPREVMEEIRQLVPFYAGVEYERLQEEGLQWPCPTPDSSGTPILYSDGTERVGSLRPVELPPPPDLTTPQYPLLFAPGRVLHQPHREMEVRVERRLNRIHREELLEIHPQEAQALDIRDGDWVEVVLPKKRFRARARLEPGLPKGMVSTTFLFGELAINLEESKEPDPMLKVPGLPLSPARVEKVTI